MVAFQDVLTSLKNLGFYEYLLPWIFTFAVVYGILSVSKLFGDMNKRISAALALVVAFFATGYAGPSMATFFQSIFGGASIILAGLLVVVLFIGMVGYEPKDIRKSGTLVVLIIVGVVLWLLSTGMASGAGYWWLLSPDLVAMILVIVVIVLAVWMITKTPKDEEKEKTPPGK